MQRDRGAIGHRGIIDFLTERHHIAVTGCSKRRLQIWILRSANHSSDACSGYDFIIGVTIVGAIYLDIGGISQYAIGIDSGLGGYLGSKIIGKGMVGTRATATGQQEGCRQLAIAG